MIQDPEYIIGIDESGTGAYAGPFTVCAFMAHASHAGWIRQLGARDSKTCSKARREYLAEQLAASAVIADIVVVPHSYLDQRVAWREAVKKAVRHCLGAIEHDPSNVLVQIDGTLDAPLWDWMSKSWKLGAEFIPRGDAKIPAISAASIYAKTTRSTLMRDAHQAYPVYGWDKNDGYGTEDHRAAIAKHGICPLHRRIRPLLPYFEHAVCHHARGAPRDAE